MTQSIQYKRGLFDLKAAKATIVCCDGSDIATKFTLPMVENKSMRAGIAGIWIFQITRATWALVAIASLVVVIASAIPRYHQLAEVTPDAALATGQLRPFEDQALENVGLSVHSYAVYFTWLEIIISITFLLIGLLIFWRRSDELMPLIFSLTLVSYGMISSPLTTSLASANPEWSIIIIFLRTVALTSLILTFLLFPDGRFVPPRAVWLGIVWVAYNDRVGTGGEGQGIVALPVHFIPHSEIRTPNSELSRLP